MKLIFFISTIFFACRIPAQEVELTSWKGNTYQPEYAPTYWNNGLVICSNVAESYGISWYDDSGLPNSDLFFYPDKNSRKRDEKALASLNTKFNEGPASFSSDGIKICYTGTVLHPSDKKKNWLGIYFSGYESGTWSPSIGFTYNSTDGSYTVAHPCLAADDNTLYFSSDMPGGFGGMDIWKCNMLPDGQWSPPLNLGSGVNTNHNELFPFCDENGVLYFASDYRDGIADYDLFRWFSKGDSTVQASVLPAPFNGDSNDYALICRNNGQEGYFGSDRKGKGDVFSFVIKDNLICTPVEEPSFCYAIEDDRILPTPNLPLRYTWEFGDGNTGNGISTQHCYAGYGSYQVQLNVYDTITSLLYAQVSQTTIEIVNPEMPYIDIPGKIMAEETIDLRCDVSTVPGIVVESVEWDFGDGSTGQGMTTQKMWNTTGTYETRVKILCSIGGNPPGIVCVSCVIEVNGEEELAQNDENANTMNVDMLAENREVPDVLLPMIEDDPGRKIYFVEFRSSDIRIPLDGEYFGDVTYEITERYSAEDEMYKYSVGESVELGDLYPLYEAMIKAGFLESVVRESEVGKRNEEISVVDHLDLEIMEQYAGAEPEFKGEIFFAKNSSVLSGHALEALDYLTDILISDPGVKVIVKAYTDSSGTEQTNQVLSRKRANATRDYLISHSIHPSRIVAMGMGENNPPRVPGDREDPEFQRKVEFVLYYPKELPKRK